jgi:acyl-coenzyme A synthetase/AMP-(fatty) acid ligase/thioesterase domain-containing protein/acyl carrier protein
MAVAALASLAAGCPYVPLDPSHPAVRNRAAIDDAKLGALIIREGVSTIGFDLPLLDVTASINAKTSDVYQRAAPDALSAIFYTSGSTGTPKGVCLDSCAVLERVRNATEMMQITADDNLALLSSPTAIASLWMTFTALLNGATLHFIDPRRHGIAGTLRLFHERRISATFAVPALLRELSLSPDATAGFSGLRALRTGGDVLPSDDLKLWRSKLPPTCRLWISLASTEAPAVFQWIVPPGWTSDGPLLPVGFRRDEIAHEIVDESGAPVMPGEAGELVVKSRALALGYWTRGALIPFDTDPEHPGIRIFNTKDLVRLRQDRLVEMVGRKDRQVKIRGHRANLLDVESELRACAGISSSAAIAVRDNRLELSIVAFVVPVTTLECVSGGELRLSLKSKLPPHMIPQRVHVVERIPLLPTFKVDVAALEEIDRVRHQLGSGSAEPSALDIPNENALRQSLSYSRIWDAVRDAWAEVLKDTSLDQNASFETVGGDSLRALHMWGLIESALGRPLSFDHFDLAMTPAALVAAIERQYQERPEENGAVANKPLHIFYMPTAGGDTPLQARFRKALRPSVTLEAIRYPTVQEMLDTNSSFEFLVECVARHIMTVSGAPLYIMGYSFGGFVAWAVACRVKQLGGEIGLVALLDPRRHNDAHEPLPAHRFVLQIADRITRNPRDAAARAFQNSLAWFLRTSSSRFASTVFHCSALLPSPLRFKFEFHFADQLRMASARQWRPQPLDCPAVLFRSDEFLPSNPDFGWKAVCPSLEVVPVHGTHDTIFDSPNREHLCERILSAINERKTHVLRIAADTSAA